MKNKFMEKKVPTVKFNSEYFKCPKCGYSEARLVIGDVSHTPCTNCGHGTMIRVK